jgi:arylsulfatase A-like enzyme
MTSKNLQVVFVVDGLRPDLIDEDTTPTIARLRREGVNCVNAHAVSPPVTRVNAAAIATGDHPGRNGLMGNELYWAAVAGDRPFRTADGAALQRLRQVSGELLHRPSLGRRLQEAGRTLVTVGSGSSGCALLLASEAADGHGVMINVNRAQDGVPVAVPTEVHEQLHRRFGPPPRKDPTTDFLPTVTYATQVIRDYVLPELQPDVLLFWITEPDHAHHTFGLTAPPAVRAREAADRSVAEVLAAIAGTDAANDPDVFILSDHGFSTISGTLDLDAELVRAGLKRSPRSTDVIVARSGCGLLYVRNRDAEHIARIVAFLQRQTFSGAIFTPPRSPADPGTARCDPGTAVEVHGWVGGTFSDRLLGYAGNPREPDIVLSLPWSDAAHRGDPPGGSVVLAPSGGTTMAAQHGNLSPYDVRSTMIGWGPSFRSGTVVTTATGNLDVAPTVLALAGLDPSPLDGRVLAECLRSAVDPGPDHGVLTVRVEEPMSGYAAAIDLARVGDHRYLASAVRQQ